MGMLRAFLLRDMAILNNAEILAWLGKGGDATEAELNLLAMLRPMVERAVKRRVGYAIEQATYTHYLPEDRRRGFKDPELHYEDVKDDRAIAVAGGTVAEAADLQLPELPVRSVASVYEDVSADGGQGVSDFPASTLLTAGVDYYLDYTTSGLSKSGHLVKCSSAWPAKPRTVKVTYTAGYTHAELTDGIAADIKLACLVTIQHYWARRGADGGRTIKSESIGDYSVTFAGNASVALPTEAKRLLQPFRSYGDLM